MLNYITEPPVENASEDTTVAGRVLNKHAEDQRWSSSPTVERITSRARKSQWSIKYDWTVHTRWKYHFTSHLITGHDKAPSQSTSSCNIVSLFEVMITHKNLSRKTLFSFVWMVSLRDIRAIWLLVPECTLLINTINKYYLKRSVNEYK